MTTASPRRNATVWQPTGTVVPRLLAGGALLLVGLLLGRFDVAVLGVPLLAAVLWGLARPPAGDTEVELRQPRYDASDGRLAASVHLRPSAGATTALLRVTTPGHRDGHVLVDAGTERALEVSIVTVRTGRQELFRVDHLLHGPHAVLRTRPGWVGPVSLAVLPKPALLGALPLPHRLQGLTGSHRSRRPGDGGDFRDLAGFAPGDRLRRIDWKATARRGTGAGPGATTELYVRRTFATADAHVMLALDARDEVGPDVATWSMGPVHPHDLTSLDLARRAATSLARRYLDQGDRVGLVQLGGDRRPLRPAGGRRQLNQLVHHLALAEPDRQPAVRVVAPALPAGVLVVVLSTFLDDVAADLAIDWRYAGHRVLALDVLPAPNLAHLRPQEHTVFRLTAMEREERLATLAAAGVEVVGWDTELHGLPVEAVLASLSRVRRAGR